MKPAGVRIAQIADLHFGRDVPAVAETLIEELREVQPTLIAVCGDLTQTAAEAEFRAASAFLDKLPAPAVVVPGNHDLPGWRFWTRFTRPWRRWRKHIASDPHGAVTYETDGLIAVGVNSARRWTFHHDWSRGRINMRQLTAIGAAFDEAPRDDLRVVIAHHPFLLTDAVRSRGLVGRSALALRHLRHRADLLLGGHIHLAYSGIVDGLVVAQCGTAVSNRLKGEPNSYNLIDATGDRLTIAIRRWTDDRFETFESHEYVRDGHEWSVPAATA
ncbi:metallophosphoesterase family protein [Catenuloplanes indicus]|uniref:3',5'-cyclic AMP phosphodiesterase CpdA n=1 Tax=Catenuloplanes indicus TaxID=137267 RepID=A0AAE4AXW5_9ACTN|nr:metallophosphoesterase [Catenuloplanes indicus]MDQ0364443.1 3',5'-cyclic AMP phosphodiesterase CpdA [Catenuloplanes indicus]